MAIVAMAEILLFESHYLSSLGAARRGDVDSLKHAPYIAERW